MCKMHLRPPFVQLLGIFCFYMCVFSFYKAKHQHCGACYQAYSGYRYNKQHSVISALSFGYRFFCNGFELFYSLYTFVCVFERRFPRCI